MMSAMMYILNAEGIVPINQSIVANIALKAPRKAAETSFSSEFRLFTSGREVPELLQDV